MHMIWIAGPEELSDLYMAKNRYFDKEPSTRNLTDPLLGDTILFSEGNELWNMYRKSLASAFYKDKLVKYVDVMQKIAEQGIKDIEANYMDKDRNMDLIEET